MFPPSTRAIFSGTGEHFWLRSASDAREGGQSQYLKKEPGGSTVNNQGVVNIFKCAVGYTARHLHQRFMVVSPTK